MKCPYAVHRQSTTQTVIEYAEDGQQKSWTEYQNNTAHFVDCQKEECGAFNPETGRCEYKG
jgi:hypothetical protein